MDRKPGLAPKKNMLSCRCLICKNWKKKETSFCRFATDNHQTWWFNLGKFGIPSCLVCLKMWVYPKNDNSIVGKQIINHQIWENLIFRQANICWSTVYMSHCCCSTCQSWLHQHLALWTCCAKTPWIPRHIFTMSMRETCDSNVFFFFSVKN